MDALKNSHRYYYKAIINKMFLLFAFISIFNYSLCEECPRERPILKNNECLSTYCPPQDFKNKICTISNPFIKYQWLNKIHTFASEGISHVCATTNSEGDLFLIAQGFTAGNAGDKYIFAFHSDGNGLFNYKKNNTIANYSFETIDFPDNKYPEVFYSVDIENNQYLLSTQIEKEMFLIDYKTKNLTIFTLNSNTYYSDDLFVLEGYDYDEKNIEYFTDYIHCKDYLNYSDCYLGLRIFKLDLTNITILAEKNEDILINSLSRIKCFQNYDLLIQCIYTTKEKTEEGPIKYNRVVTLFNNTNLNIEYTEILQEDYNRDNTFDSTIQLKDNIFVTGFSLPHDRNVIKLLFKEFVISYTKKGKKKIYLDDYLPEIPYININEDGQYEIDKGLAKRNTMVRITKNKFAILLNEFSNYTYYTSFNKNLLILICNIFDDSQISIRHYKINFELYNLVILEDIRGYAFNKFFGVLLETGVNTNSYTTKAIYLTFGYVNSTFDEIPIDTTLKENNTNSIIKIGDYVSEIENNLFAYELIGIKIVSLPNKKACGYFINNKTNEKIKEEDILDQDTILRFILVREKIAGNVCNIEFAGVVKEPSYDLMNENAERIDIYPVNNTNYERQYYSPRILTGRVINYIFDISCYESCSSCSKLSNNPNDHQCIQCKNNYYFQEGTKNCFQSLEGYYLNKETQSFSPCHSSCAACDGGIEPKTMNCLSCKEGLNLYESKNCLKCEKYINYELTECINEIPDGFFLLDKNLGILGRCHELCKTCKGEAKLYTMNCIECKYVNKNYEASYDGNCPPYNEDEDFEEEEITMPGGECPRNKPILVRNDFCFDGHCDNEEFENEICVISNSIIKTQWMNNIQRFGDGNIIFASLDYGNNGELFLFAQKRDNDTYENYIYGINNNGGPLFYNKNKNDYTFYKVIDFPNDVFLERIKFIKNFENNKTFLLSTQIDNDMYEINYNESKTIIHNFNNAS